MTSEQRYNRTVDVLDAEFIAGATALGQLPAPTFAEVAFAGRSNVGKSSLINNLVQRKKLEPEPAKPRVIATVHGVGYRYQPGKKA